MPIQVLKLSRIFKTGNAVKNVQWIKFCLRVFEAGVFSFWFDFSSNNRFVKSFFLRLFLDTLRSNFNAVQSDFHVKATIKHQMLLVRYELYVLQTLYFPYKLNKDIFYVGV